MLELVCAISGLVLVILRSWARYPMRLLVSHEFVPICLGRADA